MGIREVAILYKVNMNSRAICEMLKVGLERIGYCVECMDIRGADSLAKCRGQYLVALNGAGYENATFSGNLQYNIIPKKQLHLFTDDEKEKQYLSGYAMNIYLAVEDLSVDRPNYISFTKLKRDSSNQICICTENEQKLVSAFEAMIRDEEKSQFSYNSPADCNIK